MFHYATPSLSILTLFASTVISIGSVNTAQSTRCYKDYISPCN